MEEAVREIKGSLDEILRDAKRLAAKKLKRLVMSKSEHIALKASTELLKAELSGESHSQQPNIRFITVVNDVGVLESQAEPMKAIDADVIPPVTKPDL